MSAAAEEADALLAEADALAEDAEALAEDADALALAEELPDEHPKMPRAATITLMAASMSNLVILFIDLPFV